MSNSMDPPSTPPGTSLMTMADSSSQEDSRDLALKEWISFYFEHTKRCSDILQDDLNTIEKRCVVPDLPKLEGNSKRTEVLAVGLFRQIHYTLQKHIDVVKEFDERMSREFADRYPDLGEQLTKEISTPSWQLNGNVSLSVSESFDFKALEGPRKNKVSVDDKSKKLILGSDCEDESGSGNRNPKCEGVGNAQLLVTKDELKKSFDVKALEGPRKNKVSVEDKSKKLILGSDCEDESGSGNRNPKFEGVGNAQLLVTKDELKKSFDVKALEGPRKNKVSVEDKSKKLILGSDSEDESGSGNRNPKCEGVGNAQLLIIKDEPKNTSVKRKQQISTTETIENVANKTVCVKIKRLDPLIVEELEKTGFVRVGLDFLQGDDAVLREIRKKIRILVRADKPKGDAKSSRSLRKADKSGKSCPEQFVDSDDDSKTAGKHSSDESDPPLIQLACLEDLMSEGEDADQEVETVDEDETAARNLILSDSEENGGDDSVKKLNKEKGKDKRTSDKSTKKSKIFTPSVGEPIKLSDTDSDLSSKKPKTRATRKRKNKNKNDTEETEETSDTEVSKKKRTRKRKQTHPEESEIDEEPGPSNSKGRKRHSEMEKKTDKKPDPESPDSDDSVVVTQKRSHVKVKEENSDSDVEFVPQSKQKKTNVPDSEATTEDSDTEVKKEVSDESTSSDSADDKKVKKKKRRRIKTNSSSNEDASSSDDDVKVVSTVPASEGKGRKNIRKVIEDKSLKMSTREAAKEEQARKQRVLEKQKMFNQIFKAPEDDKLESLALDFDKDTKEPLISVDPAIVAKLKPHQAKGIQFMWDACFESLESMKSGGCILAHCMGLGKTLQSVAFVHTLLTNEKTAVKTVLVICPLNTVENWYSELRRWTEDADGRINLHKLWECKANEKFRGLHIWRKNGGIGICHYDFFRTTVNSDQKKGKYKVSKRNLQIVQETLLDPGPDLVICDEGHLLKNASSQTSKTVNKIKTMRRIVLTGTPLQNNLVEYHTMMSFVKPNLLGDIKEFRNRFVNPILNGQHKDSSDRDVKFMKKMAHVLHKLLDGCVQRLDYNVLVPYLPPKFEYAISVNLTEKQKDLYDYYIKNLAGNTGNQREKLNTTRLFTDYTILNKICTHPVVLTFKRRNTDDEASNGSGGSLKNFIVDTDGSTTEESDSDIECLDDDESKPKTQKGKPLTRSTRNAKADEGPPSPFEALENGGSNRSPAPGWYSSFFEGDEDMRTIEHSGKLQVLMEILKECESAGDKVLIFSQYLTTLDLIEQFLEELDKKTVESQGESLAFPLTSEGRYRQGIDYFRIDGNTKSRDRHDQCDRFNKTLNRAKVFLISIRAGGLGINLVGANRVVIFDASWNPSQDLQAIFRVYRFGQVKPCYIYRLLCRGTMEEKIYHRQVVKLALSGRVVDEQQIQRHFHYDELQKMYHFDRNDTTERPIPIVPKDKLFAGLLQSQKDRIFSYLEHDSLLENKAEEELDEDEKKKAWEDYLTEKDKQVPQQTGLTLEHIQELYQKNASYFRGNANWVIRTMWRLYHIYRVSDLITIGTSTRDIENIIEKIITWHGIVNNPSGNSTREQILNNMETYKQAIRELRHFYRNNLGQDDIIGYRGGIPVQAILDIINPNYPFPSPMVGFQQQRKASPANTSALKRQLTPTMINNSMRVAAGGLFSQLAGYPGSPRLLQPQPAPMRNQLARMLQKAPATKPNVNANMRNEDPLHIDNLPSSSTGHLSEQDVHILPDFREA